MTHVVSRALRFVGPALSLSLLLHTANTLRAQGDVLIDTRSAGAGQSVSSEAIRNLPTGRNAADLLSVAPGVHLDGPERPSANGASGDALFTIDGVRIGDPAVLGGSGDYGSFDRIPEMQVMTNGASAVYGADAVNGVINVVTKDGTKSWEGTGRFLGDDPYGLRSISHPRVLIELMENVREDGVGYCVSGVRVEAGSDPVATGTQGSIDFGFDSPITIGVGPGSGVTYGAGATGTLNLARIPGCDGQASGLSFVDAPAPVTPPDPTHLAFLENGVYAIDMRRVGLSYGLTYTRGSNSAALEETHPFRGDFYLSGKASYGYGGFEFAPREAEGGAAQGQGFFLYGVDVGDAGAVGTRSGIVPRWDSYAIRLGDAPSQLPDANGDGQPDSYFVSLGTPSACANVFGGAFLAGAGNANGGALEPDAGAPQPDCGFLQDGRRMGEYFRLDPGLRYDESEERPVADYDGPFSDMIRSSVDPTTGGILGGYRDDLGGPIIRDRLWFYGSYGPPEAAREESRGSLFDDSFYRSAPDYTQLFPHGLYTAEAVQSAPDGEGVQDVGLEIQSQERAWIPRNEGPVPGGAADDAPLQSLADALDSPLIYVVANGGPTGEVFQVRIVHPASGPVAIDGLVAVEPVAATPRDREDFERQMARAPGAKENLTASGYCLNQDLLAPPAGTVYRVAPAAKQAAFEPMRRVLDAARRLRQAGELNPDSDPTDYYHAIRQWAVWSVEKGYDREGFLGAFLERTEKNFREAGQPWSADVAAAVRSYGEGRWADIREILDAAESASP